MFFIRSGTILHWRCSEVIWVCSKTDTSCITEHWWPNFVRIKKCVPFIAAFIILSIPCTCYFFYQNIEMLLLCVVLLNELCTTSEQSHILLKFILQVLQRKTYIWFFNLLALELLFFNFSTPVYKMWITQEPNTLDLWNKLQFEDEKTEVIYHV